MNSVQEYFEKHPKSNQAFETSDGFIFHQDGDAQLHARDLANKNIKLHLRETNVEVAEVPVITEVAKHTVAGGKSKETIAPESIHVPVSAEVKEGMKPVAEKVTGEPVTSTEAITNVPDANHQVITAEQENNVNTAAGEAAANSTAGTAEKKQTAAEKKAAKAETDKLK